jgi:hypothetical protein
VEELADDDRAAVKRLFQYIFDVTGALSQKLQVIITDHADLNEEWFQAAVKERWRAGVRLVPSSWYEAQSVEPSPQAAGDEESNSTDGAISEGPST